MAKHVYFFGGKKTEGKADMRELLGGKGANLAEMCNLGMPVPAGFTITTQACHYYSESKGKWPKGLKEEIQKNVKKLEDFMGAKLGDPKNSLLLSVRSGAAASLPGMMDTVLNLGLSDKVVAGIAERTGQERFAWDSYRRFIQMFGDVVMNVPHHDFEHILETKKKKVKAKIDTDLTVDDLKDIVGQYKAIYKKVTREDFPD